MLKAAQLYTTQLAQKNWETAYDLRYRFLGSYTNDGTPDSNNYNSFEFVSVDKEDNILGIINYQINKEVRYAYGLFILSFCEDNNLIFANDLYQALDDIFCKYNFNKIKFCVYVGNPVERVYDKLIEKYHGRIVGIEYQDQRLIDGTICDRKLYELARENYIANRPKRFIRKEEQQDQLNMCKEVFKTTVKNDDKEKPKRPELLYIKESTK